MNGTDYIIIAIVAVVILLAGLYVYRAKKSGRKCIGCPDGSSCSSSGHSCKGGCQGCNGSCGGKKQ